MTFNPSARLSNVRKSAIRRLYDSAPPGSINLGLGEPDFQTPSVIRDEATRVLNEERLGYTTNAGLEALREKIAEYHSASSISSYGANSVCVTNGVEEALFCLVMAMVGPGDEVLMPDPGFLAYPTLVEIAGATPRYYDLPARHRFSFDYEKFDRAVSEKTKLVFVASPSNPTGRVLGREDLKHIAGRLQGSGIYVVADEIYRELYFDERPASIAEYYPGTIVLSGLSKMMSMTGWRLGWAIGPEEAIKYITLMHLYVATCAPTLSQKAGIIAFSDEGRKATAEMRGELGRRRNLMIDAIERELHLPYVAGDGAFYVMLDVSRFGLSEDVAMALLGERVITVPGGAFGSQGEGYLRLSFSIEPDLIEEGIRRIRAGMKRMG